MEAYVNQLLKQKKMLSEQINSQRIRVSILEGQCKETKYIRNLADAARKLDRERKLERLSDEKQRLAELKEQFKTVCRLLPQEISNYQEQHSCASIQDVVNENYPTDEQIEEFLNGLECYVDGHLLRLGLSKSLAQKRAERRVREEIAEVNKKLKQLWSVDESETRKLYNTMSEEEQMCLVFSHSRINIRKSREEYNSYLRKQQ